MSATQLTPELSVPEAREVLFGLRLAKATLLEEEEDLLSQLGDPEVDPDWLDVYASQLAVNRTRIASVNGAIEKLAAEHAVATFGEWSND